MKKILIIAGMLGLILGFLLGGCIGNPIFGNRQTPNSITKAGVPDYMIPISEHSGPGSFGEIYIYRDSRNDNIEYIVAQDSHGISVTVNSKGAKW